MGCSPGTARCYPGEMPAHEVRITKGFWIGQTEVPQKAWQRVMRTDPSDFKGAKLPVENITWNDAKGYCQTAGMRLPTEAEWDYVAWLTPPGAVTAISSLGTGAIAETRRTTWVASRQTPGTGWRIGIPSTRRAMRQIRKAR
jgi:formylglycine-generating enzyme required for sulfatase activity